MSEEDYRWGHEEVLGWSGRTSNGVLVDGRGKGQKFAREHDLRSLLIAGRNLPYPFLIELPLGARPVIHEKHTVGVSQDSGTATHEVTQVFGWEIPDSGKRLWEFVGGKIVLHEE